MRTFKTSVKGNEKLLGNLNFYIKMNLKLMDVGQNPYIKKQQMLEGEANHTYCFRSNTLTKHL